MNEEPCIGYQDIDCFVDVLLLCKIDKQPHDTPWVYEQGTKIFYLHNHMVCSK